MDKIEQFEKILAQGRDNALVRFTLGNAYLEQKRFEAAIKHLSKAIEFDPKYSAAWKLYGKALAASGAVSQAVSVYEKGIEIAEHRGDIQAAREMKVFLKRLQTTDRGTSD